MITGSSVKKIMLLALAILLVAIWIRNLLLLVPKTEAEHPVAQSNESSATAVLEDVAVNDTAFTVEPDLRDPFQLPRKPIPRKTSGSQRVSPKPLASVRAALAGHVLNTRQPYIVAVDSLTGASSLYHIGDTLNGFVLKKIGSREIVWKSKEGRRLVWSTYEDQ